MIEVYREYIKEFPDELERVRAVLIRSKEIEKARREKMKAKLELIQRCREEIEYAKAFNKRS